MLAQAARRELIAVTGTRIDALIGYTNDIVALIPAARSEHWRLGIRADRNAALDNLNLALGVKIAHLRERSERAGGEAYVGREFSAGPKAGFEFEHSGVFVLDASKLSDAVLQSTSNDLRNLRGDKDEWFAKRRVLFSSPNGTWEGQADTTIQGRSNLEIVTRALTAAEWKGNAAADDQIALNNFLEGLANVESQRLVSPKDILPALHLHVPGLCLWKASSWAGLQAQKTVAEPLALNTAVEPSWWLAGLNWNAAPYVRRIVQALANPDMGRQNNPKYVFKKEGLNVIIKTPIRQIFGRAHAKTASAEAVWIGAMAEWCGVTDRIDRSITEKMPLGNPKFALIASEKTWRQYFASLLDDTSTDSVTDWASTAFGGTEDIGLGTLWDESLKQNFVIEEHRELNNAEVTTKNYLDVAGAWGKRLGRLPQAGVFSPDHAPDGGVDDVDIENGLAREQQEEKSDR